MSTKKVLEKKFKSFEAEEDWLNKLAFNGWLLIEYSNDSFGKTTYTFEKQERAKEGQYKIDYVTFRDKADFEEYKEIMDESGWELIAKSRYYEKLILFTTNHQHLFSDGESLLMREERKRNSAIRIAFFLIVLGTISSLASIKFDYEFLIWLGGAWVISGLYYILVACKLSYRLRKGKLFV